MTTSEAASVVPREPYFWRRDIHRFANTVALETPTLTARVVSGGHYVNAQFKNKDSEFIGDLPEAKALVAVWYAMNEFFKVVDDIAIHAESACNIIAVVESCPVQDAVLDDETLEILANMKRSSYEEGVLYSSRQNLKHILDLLGRNAASVKGVLHGDEKVAIEERIDSHLAEAQAIYDAVDQLLRERSQVAKTPERLRKVALGSLIVAVERALEILSTLGRNVDDLPLPGDLKSRISGYETDYTAALSFLQEWRDHSDQRFGTRIKEMAEMLFQTCVDVSMLKDEAFQECRALGLQFFTRCGPVK